MSSKKNIVFKKKNNAQFHKFSISFTSKTDKSIKKQHGIYFTPKTIRQLLVDKLETWQDKNSELNILEPSCGSGEFIYTLSKKFINSLIVGIELNHELSEHCEKKFKNNAKISVCQADFLELDISKQYDLIIGNPPYFEIKKKDLKYTGFGSVISGRINIYTLFLYKCINLLKSGGILSFVIPPSILNGAYFEKIRQHIVSNCNILDISHVTGQFLDTGQSVMIFTIQKLLHNQSNDSKFIVNTATKIFSDKYIQVNDCIQNNKTIKELDCVVKTGKVVWNQHKSELLDKDQGGKLLIYSDNLSDKSVVFKTWKNLEKKQYIKLTSPKEVLKPPVILINRGFRGNRSIAISPVLISEDSIYQEFYAENHVNVILPLNQNGKKNIKKIYDSLITPKTQKFINMVIGNGQLSKTELENLIPINI
jgi:adenine-specific DNA-methyltransferase